MGEKRNKSKNKRVGKHHARTSTSTLEQLQFVGVRERTPQELKVISSG